MHGQLVGTAMAPPFIPSAALIWPWIAMGAVDRSVGVGHAVVYKRRLGPGTYIDGLSTRGDLLRTHCSGMQPSSRMPVGTCAACKASGHVSETGMLTGTAPPHPTPPMATNSLLCSCAAWHHDDFVPGHFHGPAHARQRMQAICCTGVHYLKLELSHRPFQVEPLQHQTAFAVNSVFT